MPALNQIHKCEICGNITEIVHAGGGELVCCGKPMVYMKENFEEAAIEKHIPVIKGEGEEQKIVVGEVEHPMEKEHYIEWIEIITADGKVVRKNLDPGDEPAIYCPKDHSGDIVRAYCNIHGLWSNKK